VTVTGVAGTGHSVAEMAGNGEDGPPGRPYGRGMTLTTPLLHEPGSPAYEDACTLFNAMIETRPRYVARVGSAAEVAAALAFAQDHGLEVSVRAGGHSVAGKALCEGLVIDVRGIDHVEVDPYRRTVRVGGGAIWAQVDEATQEHGLATTGGRVSTTGVAGLTLGGGSGWLERKHGLACDNLIAAELVTADGALIRATDTENPDLLWALRGGGGNFGVVTELTLALHPLGPEVLAGLAVWPEPRAAEILRRFRDLMRDAPEELSLAYVHLTVPDADPDFPRDMWGEPAIAVAGMWAGAPADGEKTLKTLREGAAADLFAPMPYAEFQRALDDPPGFRNHWTAEQAHDLPDELIDAIVEQCKSKPQGPSQLFLVGWGGAMARRDHRHSPLTGRDAKFVVHPLALWEDPADDAIAIAWSRGFRDIMAPHATGASYLNFLGDEGADRVRAAFGRESHARLARIKAQWDPRNVFRGNQNIHPAGQGRSTVG
jgi:FAD/FMN-containing dehydrogenase